MGSVDIQTVPLMKWFYNDGIYTTPDNWDQFMYWEILATADNIVAGESLDVLFQVQGDYTGAIGFYILPETQSDTTVTPANIIGIVGDEPTIHFEKAPGSPNADLYARVGFYDSLQWSYYGVTTSGGPVPEDGGPYYCFPPGQLVNTRRGPVPIELIQPGELVTTFNRDRLQTRPVLKVHNAGMSKLVKVTTRSGEVIATPGHLFETVEASTRKLCDFRVGESLVNTLGFPVPILAIEELAIVAPVYNLTVQDNPNFIVNNLRVHHLSLKEETR